MRAGPKHRVDVGGAEQHIPQEQQVAVVADAIVLREGMVREMGSGHGDRSLDEPRQGAQRRLAVQLLIPAHGRMRADDHDQLDDGAARVDPVRAQVDQHAR